MRSVLLILFITIASCSMINTKQESQDLNQIAPIDSKGEGQIGFSDNNNTTKEYIRPAYFSRLNKKGVNSWPEIPDTTGIYSAKIICHGKGRKSFEIYDKSKEVIQSGFLMDYNYACDQDYKADFLDMNFDGYLDFKVNFSTGATGNSWDEFWLFSPKDKRFHYHAELSNLIAANAYLKESRIEAYYREGMDYQILLELEWNEDSLVLLRKEVFDTSDSTFAHQIFIRKNNQMVQTHADDEIFNIRD